MSCLTREHFPHYIGEGSELITFRSINKDILRQNHNSFFLEPFVVVTLGMKVNWFEVLHARHFAWESGPLRVNRPVMDRFMRGVSFFSGLL